MSSWQNFFPKPQPWAAAVLHSLNNEIEILWSYLEKVVGQQSHVHSFSRKVQLLRCGRQFCASSLAPFCLWFSTTSISMNKAYQGSTLIKLPSRDFLPEDFSPNKCIWLIRNSFPAWPASPEALFYAPKPPITPVKKQINDKNLPFQTSVLCKRVLKSW